MEEKSLSKKILQGILVTGAVFIAASSPYFAIHISRNFSKILKRRKYLKAKQAKFDNSFYYLKRKGYLNIEKRNKQIYISLTKKGKEKAGKYLIDDLEIKKPRTWDKKWRIVVFDIPDITRIKRDAFRGKLKELGFYRLQQSVWVCPYNCQKEIKLLREFFGLSAKEMILIAGEIENDRFLRAFFKL